MKIYTVRRGDSLFNLARRFGMRAEEIASVNALQDLSVLPVGRALVIPVETVRHTILRGESIQTISRLFQTAADQILAANPAIGNGAHIHPGQMLDIPFPRTNLGAIAVNGYIADTTAETLVSTLPYLTWLSPFSYRANGAGELIPSFSFPISESAVYRTANLLTVTNQTPSGSFSGGIAHTILTDTDVQIGFLQNLLDILPRGNWAGVNLDFEYVHPFDVEKYNQFLRRLAERLHEQGYLLITALAPKTCREQSGLQRVAHDYAAHGVFADYVVLMTDEPNCACGPAVAAASIVMIHRVLEYAVTEIPRGKILMGVPGCGYDWTLPFVQGRPARPLSHTDAAALAGRTGAEIRFDPDAQAPVFRYTDDKGQRHEVWFEDARSLDAKFRLAAEFGIAGISFRSLDCLYPPNFLVLNDLFHVEKSL